MDASYKQLIEDMAMIMNNAWVDTTCAARDLHLALTNKNLYDDIKRNGNVPIVDMNELKHIDDTCIHALVQLYNQLDLELNVLKDEGYDV